MREFLRYRARRFGYDGWALKHKEAQKPLAWSVCTTRQEARDVLEEHRAQDLLWNDFEIVKVKIIAEEVPCNT